MNAGKLAIAIVTGALVCVGQALHAQQAAINVIPPETEYPQRDENGVDLATGGLDVVGPSIRIGDPLAGGIAYTPVIAGWSLNSLTLGGTPISSVRNLEIAGLPGGSNLSATLTLGGYLYEAITTHPATVSAGGKLARFWAPSSPPNYIEYTPVIGRSLAYSATSLVNNITSDYTAAVGVDEIGGTYTFEDSDGTRYDFAFQANSYSNQSCTYPCTYTMPVSRITRPNGDALNFYYHSRLGDSTAPNSYFDRQYRLLAVVSNRGYMLKFQRAPFTMAGTAYASTPNLNFNPPSLTWDGTTYVVAFNLTSETCNPFSASCSLSRRWPVLSSATLGLGVAIVQPDGPSRGSIIGYSSDITGPDGARTLITRNTTKATPDQPDVVVVRPNGRTETYSWSARGLATTGPSSLSTMCNDLATTYQAVVTVPCPFAPLQTYTNGISKWVYRTDYSAAPAVTGKNYILTNVTRTDPSGGIRVTKSIPSGQIVTITDEIGRRTELSTVSPFVSNEGRINSITYPLGNSRSFEYNSYGQVTRVVEEPATGSDLPPRETRYTYPDGCTNAKVCNRPTAITDALGNTTRYTWDEGTGQPLTEVRPAVAVSGSSALVGPAIFNAYSPMYAWISNGAGGYARTSSPVWLLTQSTACRTSATVNGACAAGSADQTVTQYHYGPQAGPNNLLLRGISVSSNGTVSITCFAYGELGNRISETRPNGVAGSDATVCP